MADPILKIRKAAEHEAQVLSAVAFRSKAYWDYSQEFMDACRAELTYSPDDIRNNHFFVAELDDLMIGFYALEQRSPTEIELEALFVEPAHIRKGYGRALIEHAKAEAGQLGASVMMIQGDPNAKNFYLAAGAKLTGERESASIPDRYLPTFSIPLSAANDA